MKKLSILAFSVCFTLIAIITNITHSQAFERHVPGIYSTIQETINAAGEGDIIILEPATYHENINYKGKTITIKSTDPNNPDIVAATIIEGCPGDQEEKVDKVTFMGGEGSNCMLSGVTIQSGEVDWCNGIIINNGSSPIINNCVIKNNLRSGIYCVSNNISPTIINCTISGNGTGISCANASPIITNCIISENSGSGISCYGSCLANITNCTISKNGGIGITCSGDSSPTISHCIITENASGGISCREHSSPNITNCIIAQNEEYGGIYCPAFIAFVPQDPSDREPYIAFPSPKITNCTITGNKASLDPMMDSDNAGGGISCRLLAIVFMVGMFPMPGGRIFRHISSPTITNCIIWGNYPDEVDGNKIKITYSNVRGRWRYQGRGNINADPLFVDPNEGDYRLQPDSPCINKGKYRSEMGAYGTYEYGLRRLNRCRR